MFKALVDKLGAAAAINFATGDGLKTIVGMLLLFASAQVGAFETMLAGVPEGDFGALSGFFTYAIYIGGQIVFGLKWLLGILGGSMVGAGSLGKLAKVTGR